jgi:hypothetical protein
MVGTLSRVEIRRMNAALKKSLANGDMIDVPSTNTS